MLLCTCTYINVYNCLIILKEVHFEDVVGHGAYGTVHKGTWQGNTVAFKEFPFLLEWTKLR